MAEAATAAADRAVEAPAVADTAEAEAVAEVHQEEEDNYKTDTIHYEEDSYHHITKHSRNMQLCAECIRRIDVQ